MNKKEQAAFEELRKDLAAMADQVRVAKALSWTGPVEPDIPAPESGNEMTKGYLFNVHTSRTAPACSSASSHGYGRQDITGTQGGRRLYSTHLLAAKALRHEVEKECAERLAKIDKLIEDLTGI